MSSDSVKWSLSGTEREYFKGRSLAIDGVENVIKFLEKLESGHITDIDFLELRVCDQGCAGGILCPGNRFLTVERIGERQKRLQERLIENKVVNNPLMKYKEQLHRVSKTEAIYPREGLLLDADVEIALRKMQKIKTLKSYLPGFDCGACGAPTCKNLAEDIVKGEASMSHCVFVQRVMEKNYKLSPEQAFQMIEKIWGKRRIMEVYLNVVEWAPGVYGAQAASRHWFGKDARDLSPREAARLAAILPAPRRYKAAVPGPSVRRRASRVQAAMGTVRNQGLNTCVVGR